MPEVSVKNQKSSRAQVLRDGLIDFCWGALYHFHGLDHISLIRLDAAGKTMSGLGQAPSERALIDACENLKRLIKERRPRDFNRKEELKKLGDLIRDQILTTSKPIGPVSFSAVPPGNDISRNPFNTTDNTDELLMVAYRSVVHLLSAYTTVFSKGKEERDFNTSKRALNDCFQSFQLLWRLYQSSDSCHHRIDGGRHVDFARRVMSDIEPKVKDTDDPVTPPYESAYFIWAMFAAIDVIRGDIYYQTEFYEQAKELFTKGLKRASMIRRSAERVHSGPRKKAFRLEILDSITTPTLNRARFERSKILFDKGLVLASMAQQLKCLRQIIIGSIRRLENPDSRGGPYLKLPKNLNNVEKIRRKLDTEREKLSRAIEFLEIERYSPVWDKRPVCRMFNYGDDEYFIKESDRRKYGSTLKKLALDKFWSADVIRPETILEAFEAEVTVKGKKESRLLLSNRTQRFIAEIFARLGYSLLILRIDLEDGGLLRCGYVGGWLTQFLKPEAISPKMYSPMAYYARSIVEVPFRASSRQGFQDNAARQLALRLREKTKAILATRTEDLRYVNLLNETTHNIGNLVTIPQRNQRLLMRQGYLERRRSEELGNSEPINKLVVLRRWQSYNPKLPRPDSHRLRGGGYLLIWEGKGIVIDPGYDFIQNLYEEGFSLEDIHAIVVSHSHADHDDDLTTLLTMFYEWFEYRRNNGHSALLDRKIDLFLNESSYRKFTTWLHADETMLGRIIPLPQVTWNSRTDKPQLDAEDGAPGRVGPKRGENVKLDLTGKDGYSMELEVVPAWHHDVLNSTGAAGFVFHLYEKGASAQNDDPICRLGYTGDTGAYGMGDTVNAEPVVNDISCQYAKCDVLIAHLGDARLREISTLVEQTQPGVENPIHTLGLLRDMFCSRSRTAGNTFEPGKMSREKVTGVIQLFSALHLIDDDFLKVELSIDVEGEDIPWRGSITYLIRRWLEKLNPDDAPAPRSINRQSLTWDTLKEFFDNRQIDLSKCDENITRARRHIDRYQTREQLPRHADYSCQEAIYILLTLLAGSCNIHWEYKYHLGIRGIEHLFSKMCKNVDSEKTGLFIVGELPEELSSYRHRMARWLNTDVLRGIQKSEVGNSAHPLANVRAFTGDIGLHVRLEEDGKYAPGIRCDYCNFDNDAVKQKKTYYPPEQIQETPIKALDSRMVYLCEDKNHHPERKGSSYYHYLFMPEIKRI